MVKRAVGLSKWQIIRSAVPEAEESIAYGMPA
jgi:uncharacterized protein YdhG (YjbR/CyaY superfamily)